MFISDTDKKSQNSLLAFLFSSAFCFLFSSIYNKYGHEVYSFYMSFLFLWPLLGAIWYMLLLLLHKSSGRISRNAFGAGIATVTVGSLLKGIFEIAGTSSPYENAYFIVGIMMVGFGILSFGFYNFKKSRS